MQAFVKKVHNTLSAGSNLGYLIYNQLLLNKVVRLLYLDLLYQFVHANVIQNRSATLFLVDQAHPSFQRQVRLSGFSPVGMELAFGMKGGLDQLKIELPKGFELHLRGQVDRQDQATDGEQFCLHTID